MELTLLFVLIDLIFIVWGYNLWKQTDNNFWVLGTMLWSFWLGTDTHRLLQLMGWI